MLHPASPGSSAFRYSVRVCEDSDVWTNGRGCHLGKRPYGYVFFVYDMTPYLHFGKEPGVHAVRVDNFLPPNSRCYLCSGIYPRGESWTDVNF